MNLAGAMFWSLDNDDFTGTHCNQGKYPLINTVKKYFEENKSPIIQPEKTQTYNNELSSLSQQELINQFNKEINSQFDNYLTTTQNPYSYSRVTTQAPVPLIHQTTTTTTSRPFVHQVKPSYNEAYNAGTDSFFVEYSVIY